MMVWACVAKKDSGSMSNGKALIKKQLNFAAFPKSVALLHFSSRICAHSYPMDLAPLSQMLFATRRPPSADRTVRRQFQATGQPASRTQASDAMASQLLRYEPKWVQRRCFQCGSVPLRSDIKGTELTPVNILIPLERQLIALQLCR